MEVHLCIHPLNLLPSSANSIRNDLTNEKPIWPYTSYGPSKGEPNLISGQDVSFEELRAEFMKAKQANNPSQYVCQLPLAAMHAEAEAVFPSFQPEDSLLQKVNTAYGNVLSNIDQAVTFARSQSKKAAPTGPTTASTSSPFGSGSNATPFGAPAKTFGNQSATFGSTSAFRQAAPSTSAFGQPASTSAFGQTSAFGTPAKPAGAGGFGGFASTTPATSAFGQTSAFGSAKPAFGTSAFGMYSLSTKPVRSKS
jgi:nucleoporin NUP42